MKKNIYHGSVQQLPQPTFNGGKAHNDYGKGSAKEATVGSTVTKWTAKI